MSQMMDIVFKKHRENVSFQFPLEFFKTNKHFFWKNELLKLTKYLLVLSFLKRSFHITIVFKTIVLINDRFQKWKNYCFRI